MNQPKVCELSALHVIRGSFLFFAVEEVDLIWSAARQALPYSKFAAAGTSAAHYLS